LNPPSFPLSKRSSISSRFGQSPFSCDFELDHPQWCACDCPFRVSFPLGIFSLPIWSFYFANGSCPNLLPCSCSNTSPRPPSNVCIPPSSGKNQVARPRFDPRILRLLFSHQSLNLLGPCQFVSFFNGWFRQHSPPFFLRWFLPTPFPGLQPTGLPSPSLYGGALALLHDYTRDLLLPSSSRSCQRPLPPPFDNSPRRSIDPVPLFPLPPPFMSSGPGFPSGLKLTS